MPLDPVSYRQKELAARRAIVAIVDISRAKRLIEDRSPLAPEVDGFALGNVSPGAMKLAIDVLGHQGATYWVAITEKSRPQPTTAGEIANSVETALGVVGQTAVVMAAPTAGIDPATSNLDRQIGHYLYEAVAQPRGTELDALAKTLQSLGTTLEAPTLATEAGPGIAG